LDFGLAADLVVRDPKLSQKQRRQLTPLYAVARASVCLKRRLLPRAARNQRAVSQRFAADIERDMSALQSTHDVGGDQVLLRREWAGHSQGWHGRGIASLEFVDQGKTIMVCRER
ncbi:MAG TPA: hypothetical protein VHQ90_09440, partial [Thermoanaerobaculia bacterium]|nr:hypothetical protein [Thermoanaerobaculia bacterium]